MLRRMLMYHILCQCPCAASSLWGPCAACHIYSKHFAEANFGPPNSKQMKENGIRSFRRLPFPLKSLPAHE
jgi:hypothetical protein